MNNLLTGAKPESVKVSILVLLELPRERDIFAIGISRIICFNPCFIGIAA